MKAQKKTRTDGLHQYPGQKKGILAKLEPFWYLLPFIVSIGLFTLYPIVNVFITSFKENYNQLTGAYETFSLQNYQNVIGDPYFRSALKNTTLYVVCVVPISTCLAILFATLLNMKTRVQGLFQTAFFLPMVTSVTAVGLAWKWMYNADYGVINYFLSLFGVEPLGWLTDVKMGIPSLVVYGVWSILPFTIIILLAGMQSIDENFYTAAKVDGAGSLRIFFRVTLPLLAPTIGLVVTINIINTFKVFNELFPLYNGKPGSAYNLYTAVYYIYDQFQIKWKLGNASAAAIVLFLIILVFTLLQQTIQRRWKTDSGEGA